MKRILIVNENRELLRLMKHIMVAANADCVETTQSATQAHVSIITACPPHDLVIVEKNVGGVQEFKRILALALSNAVGTKILITSADFDTMDDLVNIGYASHGLINLPWGDNSSFVEITDELLGRKTRVPAELALN